MNIQIRLPAWAWVARLINRVHPGIEERAALFGKASANKRYLHGAIDVGVTCEMVEK